MPTGTMVEMTRFTDRDKIWNNALMKDRVTPSHYTEVFGVSEQEAVEALETMHRLGLLERYESERGEVTYSTKIAHPKAIPQV